MASVTVDVPDALVPDLTMAIARKMRDTDDVALALIVAKVLASQSTTGAEKQALAQAFMRSCARAALIDYRSQQAAEQARSETSQSW